MSAELEIFFLSITPIGELRAAIPYGILFRNYNIFLTFIIAVFGNFLPPILILLTAKKFSEAIKRKEINKKRFVGKILNFFAKRAEKRGEKVQKKGFWGLVALVAIPLPVTGAWTGALASFILNYPLKKSLLAIFLGVTIAGVIITLLVLGGVSIYNFLGVQSLLGTIIAASLFVFFFFKNKKI